MKRTASPRLRPFEFRVGVGMPGFRGMRTVGDPSFVPPTKFRYLQNVRLGDGDIKGRPGLKSFDVIGQPVTWMTEVEGAIQSATIYWGPVTTESRLLLNGSSTDYLAHAYSRHDFSKLSAGSTTPDENWASLFFLFPTASYQSVFSSRFSPMDGDLYALAPVGPFCYSESRGFGPTDPDDSKRSGWEDQWFDLGYRVFSLAREPFGFFQTPNCMDPLVRFIDDEGNARWLAAGIHRGERWSTVGDFVPPYYSGSGGTGFVAATGDPDVGGQPVVEVNFETESPLDRAALAGYSNDDPPAISPVVPAFPGGLTEVFRLPPPGYKRGLQSWFTIGSWSSGVGPNIPPASWDATMFPNCEWIRSMRAVSRRADDPLTGEEITRDKLYIGTAGGKVMQINGQLGGGGADTSVVMGINDPDDGAVWSFDGVTVTKEVENIGQLVCIERLPAGGIIAAGRTAAAYLDQPDGSWSSVGYNPVPHVDTSGTFYFNQFAYGYYWTSRCLFQGEAYFIGFDIGWSMQNINPGFEYFYDIRWAKRLVIGKFNRATLNIDIVRRGDAFDQYVNGGSTHQGSPTRYLYANPTGPDGLKFYARYAAGNDRAPQLVTDGPRMYYLTAWGDPVPSGLQVYVGEFDGTTWDDDAYSWALAAGPRHILVASGTLYAIINPRKFYKLEGGVATLYEASGPAWFGVSDRYSYPFVGP